MRTTLDFKRIRKTDVHLAGGKGASLGEMTQAGIPVPPGFVVLSEVFERFLQETDLNVEIDAALEAVDHKKIHTVEGASEKIQALILEAEMPEDIAEDIKGHFKRLRAKHVAVRSSATAEDSSSAAWAGQLDSFLNTTEEKLLENVKRCWASLFTPRAIFYRFEKNLHAKKISVAVVVQKMVESEVSGVAFSVHPVTQDRNQLIIEAGFGLGEAIVSGQITPDSYVVTKKPRRIIDKNIQTQERGIYRSENGGNDWRTIPQDLGGRQALNDDQILELSEIVIGIETHYGFPCDVEWAFEKGKFSIVQSRPITTLMSPEKDAPPDLISAFESAVKGKEMTKQEGNFSLLLLGTGIGGCYRPYMEKYYDFDFGPVMFFAEGKHGLVFFDLGRYVDTTLTTYKKWVARHGDVDEYEDFKKFRKQADDLYARDVPSALKSASVKELGQILNVSFDLGRRLIAATVFCESLDEPQVRTYYREIAPKGDSEVFFKNATKPVFGSFALRADKALLEKSSRSKLQFLLCDYYLAPPIAEVGRRIDDLISKRGGMKKIRAEAREIQKGIAKNTRIMHEFRGTLPRKLASLFDFVQTSMYVRDMRKEAIQKVFTVLSNAGREIFARKGMNPEDVAFALYADFLEGTHTLNTYPEEILKRKDQGVTVLFSDKEILFEYGEVKGKMRQLFRSMEGNAGSSEIAGNSAYAGFVTGRVKIILSEKDFSRFKPGEILVTSMTRPEFVPLMKKAKAVITDEGGITCHAAIVSRELRIPCIIGTKTATRILKDGDLVEVDATKGAVRTIERREEPLAEKFIKEIGNQELRPPVHNSSVLVHQSGWHTKKYFDPYYNDHLPSPILLLARGKGAVLYLSQTKERHLVKDTFRSYWKKPSFLKERLRAFEASAKVIDSSCLKRFSYRSLRENPASAIIEDSKRLEKALWHLNAMVFFSIYFDRKICEELMDELHISISPKRFEEIWKRAIVPVGISFDKRRQLYLLGLIAAGEPWDSIAEKCQYFETAYDRVASLSVVKKKLRAEYGAFAPTKAKKAIEAENRAVEKRQKENASWLKSLAGSERKIVEFTQFVIELRDARKDFIMKPVTAFYRMGERFFDEAGIGHEFIFYVSVQELQKGAGYLEKNKAVIESRPEGMSLYVDNDNRQEIEFGAAEAERNEKIVTRFYHEQQSIHDHASADRIEGQSGSSGKAQGTVKIIRDFQLENKKLKPGEILVTGMTRPEFVPLMKIAGGIITDEGGVTCHAAIVSRELGIPCVIGTKIATQVLHDGDQVEIDATKGVVKIVEKAKRPSLHRSRPSRRSS